MLVCSECVLSLIKAFVLCFLLRLIYWVSVVFGSSVRALGFALSFLPLLVLLAANLYFIGSVSGQEAVFYVTPPTTASPPKQRWWGWKQRLKNQNYHFTADDQIIKTEGLNEGLSLALKGRDDEWDETLCHETKPVYLLQTSVLPHYDFTNMSQIWRRKQNFWTYFFCEINLVLDNFFGYNFFFFVLQKSILMFNVSDMLFLSYHHYDCWYFIDCAIFLMFNNVYHNAVLSSESDISIGIWCLNVYE